MPRVHRLPDTLINQIAAGEVVERPASVVKELVENALDAGARTVRIRLLAGGRELVEVEDDGHGMERDDALLALERHATSKIAALPDLEALSSFGFRGEALPSIAAVSHLVLETAASAGEGTRVEVSFGAVSEVRPCAHPRGTTVRVRDLFERLPARRKFLRSESTELRHVLAALSGLAFTNPAIGFYLDHRRRTLLSLPPADGPFARLPELVGRERAARARPIDSVHSGVHVLGAIIPGGAIRDTVLAVNGRVVRDRLLAAAVNRALRDHTGVVTASAYLDIRLALNEVDVNVHPTKAEVRFSEPGRVVAAVTSALAAARLALHGPVEVRRLTPAPSGPAPLRPLPLGAPFHDPGGRGSIGPRVSEPSPSGPEGWPTDQECPTPLGRYIGQYRQTYLVVEDGDGLLLVDQHVAHERVLVERLLAAPAETSVQRLLVPELVELTPHLAALAESTAAELAALGLEIEPASGATIRVLGVPASLPPRPPGPLIEELLRDLGGEAAPGESLRERAAASLACHAAIKKNQPLSRLGAEHLLRDLATTQDRYRCPHGRPTVLRLPADEIERRIGRR